MKRHPLDVPPDTVFSNTLAAAKPDPDVFKKAIARLEALLRGEESRYPEPREIVPPDA